MGDKKQLYHIKTGKLVTFFNLDHLDNNDRCSIEYIYGWIEKNLKEGKKPPLRLPSTNASFETMINSMKAAIVSGNVKVDMAKSFIFHAFENQPGILQGEWKLFNRVIGRANDTIKIGNIMNVRYEGISNTWPTGTAVEKNEVKWMLLYLSAPHRLYNQPQYGNRNAELNDLLKECGAPTTANVNDAYQKYESWHTDRWYCALMIAVYMFLTKFKDHEFSVVGTGVVIPKD